MVQSSVYTSNNVNLDPEMCLRRGEGVIIHRNPLTLINRTIYASI